MQLSDEAIKECKGKTVESINNTSGCNVLYIRFTDGSVLALETEYAGSGIMAIGGTLVTPSGSSI